MSALFNLMNHPLINEWDYNDIVSIKDREKLINHQYKGKDESILYQKFTSKFCQMIVDNYIPEHLA